MGRISRFFSSSLGMEKVGMSKMVVNAVVVMMVVCGVVVEGQRLGIDVSVAVSQSEFASAKAHGKFSFAIPRLWRSFGQADPNGASNVANAQAAGYAVDGYASHI